MSIDMRAIEESKTKARTMWSTGDYDAVADGIWAAGAAVTRTAAVAPGDAVLDIACGTGNAAVQAAMAGGKVTGVDLTPALFDAGRRRAAKAGVEVEFVEGDAEMLPFGDALFDVVLSTFGVMFAPRHDVAASEIARVLRPGGRIGLATWDPAGSVGTMFQTAARYLPAPPAGSESPMLWGDETHVRRLLGDRIDLDFITSLIPLEGEGEIEDRAKQFMDLFPPLVTLRGLLESQGAWESARADLSRAVAGMFEVAPSYLLVGGAKQEDP